ncbi:MAG: peptidyl-prolyl cis-trans isomerase [Candidatus Thiodiazotropha sp. (ex Lucinoma aequizonata)]|nr:peptidyl-prolyl cis-trans isomerase [Candidatus Thiodiazotropha sp. (ex Lucinoma aequizonata)]MCU7887159.1 peptidyl-prolyl cis-trans isomerase [Candidatus Thiodiazotropha sp. (ex Lucinoma aequizonata)]MCU7895937.1 peptidyl-prolyl cis-trans isomerase [Candidatus Thiodiazotropha sp. (ex Lucinoma aequizonata)]MCU7900201.1 peptidyl-prolyl cis-trans isomerase [Candidatus Thiodiazotropha sp. (ex Lucinoma aequizonata)]MCU7902133.1 peptidyl-prolyl cis-trans isomerase [Candidatus Thiodiazotropha sp. 
MITLTTNLGPIVIELDEANTPKSCENFKQYVKNGFFDGTIFHRVINNFMIQGGGFMPGIIRKQTGEPIKNEAKNGLSNESGTIAMARTIEPHSATAEFFTNVANNKFLDHPGQDGWGYCVFGKVSSGMDLVNQIKGLDTTTQAGHQDIPVEDIIIEKAEITE